MRKQELVSQVAKVAAVSQQKATAVIDALIHAVTDALQAASHGRRRECSLVDFGTFSVSERPARHGRNPATGAAIDIPARKSPSFKAGKVLKEAVKG